MVLCVASKAAVGRCLTNLSRVDFTYNYPYGAPMPYRGYYSDNGRTVLNDGNLPTRIKKRPTNCLTTASGDHSLKTLCELPHLRSQW